MKNSSDSALQKALKNNLQDNLDIVTARMDPLFDDFLLQARDGKTFSTLLYVVPLDVNVLVQNVKRQN